MVLNSCVYPQVEKYLMVQGNMIDQSKGRINQIMIATETDHYLGKQVIR